MKRFFADEKERVTLNKRKLTLLYYRSENIIAEIAADNIAFYLIGSMARLIYAAFLPLRAFWGSASGDMLDIL